MKYRDAKKLAPNDIVIRKTDKSSLTVTDIEVYGQWLKVRINCQDADGTKFSLYQDDVE